MSSANASSLDETTKQLDKVATKHQNEGSEGKKEEEEEEEEEDGAGGKDVKNKEQI